MSTSIRTRTLQASHTQAARGKQRTAGREKRSEATLGRQKDTPAYTHLDEAKSSGCMILNQLPSGLNKSHPRIRPIACQDIASHLPLLFPSRRPVALCVRVLDRVEPGHTTLTCCIKTTHRPRRPFTVLGVVLLFPHTSLDLIPSHLGRPRCFLT